MTPPTPTTEPTTLVAGDSWQWDVTLTDFSPSDGWQLAYALRGPADLDIVWGTHVTVNGGVFEVRVPSTASDLTPSPRYVLTGFVTNGADRRTVFSGTVSIFQNPATAVGQLSHDERVLAAIDATIEGRATKKQSAIRIGGTTVELLEPVVLSRWQDFYRARVLAATNPDALTPQREVEFVAPA